MPSAKAIACAVAVLLVLTAVPVAAVQMPVPADWAFNKQEREDLRPLEIPSSLEQKPTIDGVIGPDEWRGAVLYETIGNTIWLDPMSMGMPADFGTLYVGLYGGYLHIANDWRVNDNPDPQAGGANAWRFGTSTGPGAGNSGNGDWYEVYVQEAVTGPDTVMARRAPTESYLQFVQWQNAADFGIAAGANFNGQNWQYELFMGESPNAGGPGELPICWHWEWQQIDPRPLDGMWIPVYDGSVHNNSPEPGTMILLGGGLLGLVLKRRKRS